MTNCQLPFSEEEEVRSFVGSSLSTSPDARCSKCQTRAHVPNCSMAVATSTPMFFQKDVKRSCTLREMHHYSREIGIKRSKSCADLPRLDALPSRQNPDCATSFVLAPPERGGTRGTRERMGISEQRIRAYGERRSPRAIASGGLAGRRHQRRRASTNSSGFGSASNLCSLVRGASVHGLPTHGDPRALTYHPRATAVEQSQQFAFETEFLFRQQGDEQGDDDDLSASKNLMGTSPDTVLGAEMHMHMLPRPNQRDADVSVMASTARGVGQGVGQVQTVFSIEGVAAQQADACMGSAATLSGCGACDEEDESLGLDIDSDADDGRFGVHHDAFSHQGGHGGRHGRGLGRDVVADDDGGRRDGPGGYAGHCRGQAWASSASSASSVSSVSSVASFSSFHSFVGSPDSHAHSYSSSASLLGGSCGSVAEEENDDEVYDEEHVRLGLGLGDDNGDDNGDDYGDRVCAHFEKLRLMGSPGSVSGRGFFAKPCEPHH